MSFVFFVKPITKAEKKLVLAYANQN